MVFVLLLCYFLMARNVLSNELCGVGGLDATQPCENLLGSDGHSADLQHKHWEPTVTGGSGSHNVLIFDSGLGLGRCGFSQMVAMLGAPTYRTKAVLFFFLLWHLQSSLQWPRGFSDIKK